MTVTETYAEAAKLRRLAATAERHEHGDVAFMRFRSAVPGVGVARRTPIIGGTELRAVTELRNGKELVHTFGYFTRYNRAYPMWDAVGAYHEKVRAAAGAKSLAAKPETCFLTNHGGMAMCRTTSGTLDLEERAGSDPGGWHDGWMNPKRSDVSDLVIAIEDGNVPQMSFAFMIPEGGGIWSDDFATFEIVEYDINGGDVSAVNFGANPYTDITARTGEILSDMERLPQGALIEAYQRLTARSRDLLPREHIEVRRAPREVDPTASPQIRRLQGRKIRTAARFADLAHQAGLTIEDLATAQLPWYEIRAGEPVPADDPAAPPVESADVYVFDEIGGSFGVDAKTFAKELNAITAPQINVHINSPGGSVFAGLAIHSALLHHASHITTFVDGIAASAASVIALGGDEIVTMPGAQWMIHDASMMIEGNQADLTKGATHIGRQSDNIAEMYAGRMNITPTEARDLMLAETWAFAEESVELGLADRMGERNPAKVPQDMVARMSCKHDLTRFGYRFHSRADAPAPRQTRGTDFAKGGMIKRDATPDQPKGRSIALIEAQLGLDERS